MVPTQITKQLSGKVLVETARYQLAKEALVKVCRVLLLVLFYITAVCYNDFSHWQIKRPMFIMSSVVTMLCVSTKLDIKPISFVTMYRVVKLLLPNWKVK